jgi:Kef-type K+ transport system membrane component KefB
MASGGGSILLDLLVILVGGKLGGAAAIRLRQPAVLGELVAGILLGSSLLGGLIGMPDLALEQRAEGVAAGMDAAVAGPFYLAEHASLGAVQVLSLLATLGAILLLFEVGLESDIRELAKVGASSLGVAVIGIVVSFAAGYASSLALSRIWAPWQAADQALPPYLLHVFVGAALTATSVGITARVLGDMGRLRTPEARIILGAAVLDDVGGLLVLAVVTALVQSARGAHAVTALDVLRTATVAVGFLAVSTAVGLRTVPKAYDALVERVRIPGFPTTLAIAFALLMGYLAEQAGLASIVGAFAGGLLLARAKNRHQAFEGLRPISALFVGFFFVTLGMRVDVGRMEGHAVAVLLAGVALAAVAVAAKLACGFGVVRVRASRLVVGVGMAPRGEVGLVFAALGLSSGLIGTWQYATLVLVVLLTTFITPLWLKGLQGRFKTPPAPGPPSAQALGTILEP